MQTPKWLGLLVVGCALAPPTPALAQAATQKDFVGTWLYTRTTPGADGESPLPVQIVLTLESDNSWKLEQKVNGVEHAWWTPFPGAEQQQGRWLAAKGGLTLEVTRTTGSGQASREQNNFQTAFRDNKLLLTSVGSGRPLDSNEFECRAWVFERVDPSKPLPSPLLLPPPRPITLKPADLVGTWVYQKAADPKDPGARDYVDTLTLRADSSWTQTVVFLPRAVSQNGKPDTTRTAERRVSKGPKWHLGAGDFLFWLVAGDDKPVWRDGRKVALQNQGQELLDYYNAGECGKPTTYERVSPSKP